MEPSDCCPVGPTPSSAATMSSFDGLSCVWSRNLREVSIGMRPRMETEALGRRTLQRVGSESGPATWRATRGPGTGWSGFAIYDVMSGSKNRSATSLLMA